MLKLNWKTWVAVWLGVTLVGAALVLLLSMQDALVAAKWVGAAFNTVATGWTLFGLFHWREVPWVKRLNAFVLAFLGFGLLISLFLAVDWEAGWRTTAYLGLAVVGFLLGVNILRLLLRPTHPILGVARTTIEEALRMGIALIFIIGLLVLLVLMPLVLGSEDRVTYMVQRFLTYSIFVVTVLLGLMTVLLSARTVSLELSTRQIHMTLTKPLSRWQYLLGKWLGIVMLNAVLVAVGGVAIYGFTMSIAQNPALNDLDRYEVDREVLTARLALRPKPIDISLQEMYKNVLEDKQRRDPAKFGQVGEPIGALPNDYKQEIVTEAVSQFYTIDGGATKQFRFEGLSQAVKAAEQSKALAVALLRDGPGLDQKQAQQAIKRVLGQPNELSVEAYNKITPAQFDEVRRLLERDVIQLTFSPTMSPKPKDLFAEITLKINDYPWPPARLGRPAERREIVLEAPNQVPIPAGLIKSDGTLIIEMSIPRTRLDGAAQPFLRLNHKDSEPKLYYRVGSFERNLASAMAVVWIKLCFFAMFGLVMGSLLSFPVAALAGLIVFVGASASGAINESLDTFFTLKSQGTAWDTIVAMLGTFFMRIGDGKFYDAFRVILRLIAEGFMLLIPSFGKFPVADPLSNGEAIRGSLVFKAFWQVGLLWTGIVGLVGLLLFSKREIARVTV